MIKAETVLIVVVAVAGNTAAHDGTDCCDWDDVARAT